VGAALKTPFTSVDKFKLFATLISPFVKGVELEAPIPPELNRLKVKLLEVLFINLKVKESPIERFLPIIVIS
jgi:hypothetical protein